MSLSLQQSCKLEERIKTAQSLLAKAEKICAEKLQGATKLCAKFQAELRFLGKIKTGKIEFKDDHLNSTNLTSLEALVNIIQQVDLKDAILENFHFLSKEDTVFGDEKQTITVDIVCQKGTVWLKVIARNAKALLNAWEGNGGFGEKSICCQADLYINAAKTNPCDFRTPKIYFIFCKGVPEKIAIGLQKMDINVKGKIVNEYSKNRELSYDILDLNFEENDKEFQTTAANLDVTALLSLVSNLCHGYCSFEFDVPVLSEQARGERKSAVLQKIENFLDGKTMYACETAINSFQTIVETIGGPKEKLRAVELLKRVQIVSDNPSDRTRLLQNSGKINPRSKTIFGTGDSLKAVTVTANTGFVRAASQAGVRFNVFLHDARALTEMKENSAKIVGESEL